MEIAAELTCLKGTNNKRSIFSLKLLFLQSFLISLPRYEIELLIWEHVQLIKRSLNIVYFDVNKLKLVIYSFKKRFVICGNIWNGSRVYFSLKTTSFFTLMLRGRTNQTFIDSSHLKNFVSLWKRVSYTTICFYLWLNLIKRWLNIVYFVVNKQKLVCYWYKIT